MLQHYQHGYDKLVENITPVQGKIGLTHAGLKEVREFMERRAHEEGFRMLNDPSN